MKMETNIPLNAEKGNTSGLKKLFVPTLIVLVGLAGFGAGKLAKIEEVRPPVSVEILDQPSQIANVENSVSSSKISPQGVYVAARGGMVYYLPSCPTVSRILEKNKIWFESREQAEKAGFKPSSSCADMKR